MLVKQLVNHSETNLYAVDANDQKYTIVPSDFVTRRCLEYSAISGAFETTRRIISVPIPGMPVFVPELALMVYATQIDRENDIIKYGSGRLMINTMFSGLMPMMQGSYKVIVNLSDNDYFFIEGHSIYKLPKYDPTFRSQYIANASIPFEKLETHDLIVVVTILRHDGIERPTIISYENQFVPKNLWTDDPILFVTNGMILFKSQNAAEKFIQTYNDFADYFIEKSLETVEEKHQREIERLEEEHRRERGNIMRNAILLSGTTILGVVAEKLIVWLLEKHDEKK